MTAAFLLPATPGFAQDGVTFDPGSPTGKEYAIPFEEARRNASSDRTTLEATQRRGERSAPLFGEGIGDDSSGGGGGGGSTNGNGGAKGDGGSGSAGESGSTIVDRSLSATNTLRAAAPDGGAQSALMIGGLALALLVLGGVIGSIARRRTS